MFINIGTVVVVTPLLDPIWGYSEVLKFVIGVNFICSVFTALLRGLLFYVHADPKLLFNTIGGFFGSSTGLVVALKQINPEKEWKIGNLSVRAKYLPSIYLLVGLLLFAMPYTQSVAFEFSFFGLITSWIYLRYFQYHDGIYGDQTNQFKFSTLFPEPIQPFFETASRVCCCSRGKKRSTTITDTDTLPSTSSKDADRQRKLALKVLDDKFQTIKELTLPIQTTDQPQLINT